MNVNSNYRYTDGKWRKKTSSSKEDVKTKRIPPPIDEIDGATSFAQHQKEKDENTDPNSQESNEDKKATKSKDKNKNDLQSQQLLDQIQRNIIMRNIHKHE